MLLYRYIIRVQQGERKPTDHHNTKVLKEFHKGEREPKPSEYPRKPKYKTLIFEN